MPTKEILPFGVKMFSHSSNMMPSRSHERKISSYTYVTGKVPHMKEMIPFCTLGWKPIRTQMEKHASDVSRLGLALQKKGKDCSKPEQSKSSTSKDATEALCIRQVVTELCGRRKDKASAQRSHSKVSNGNRARYRNEF